MEEKVSVNSKKKKKNTIISISSKQRKNSNTFIPRKSNS